MREALALDDSLGGIVRLRRQVDDVSIGSGDARSLDEAALHVAADFQVPEQEEFRVVAGLGGLERRAQGLPGLSGSDQVGRDLCAWASPMLVPCCNRSLPIGWAGFGIRNHSVLSGVDQYACNAITI